MCCHGCSRAVIDPARSVKQALTPLARPCRHQPRLGVQTLGSPSHSQPVSCQLGFPGQTSPISTAPRAQPEETSGKHRGHGLGACQQEPTSTGEGGCEFQGSAREGGKGARTSPSSDTQSDGGGKGFGWFPFATPRENRVVFLEGPEKSRGSRWAAGQDVEVLVTAIKRSQVLGRDAGNTPTRPKQLFTSVWWEWLCLFVPRCQPRRKEVVVPSPLPHMSSVPCSSRLQIGDTYISCSLLPTRAIWSHAQV